MLVRQIATTALQSVLLVAHIIKYQKAVKKLYNKTAEARESRKKKRKKQTSKQTNAETKKLLQKEIKRI